MQLSLHSDLKTKLLRYRYARVRAWSRGEAKAKTMENLFAGLTLRYRPTRSVCERPDQLAWERAKFTYLL